MTACRELTIFLTAVALAGAGCGSEKRQDADEAKGSFAVDVTRASFAPEQQIAAPEKMRIDVENTGTETIPNVAVTVDSFTKRSEQAGLADPKRPVWIVDEGPKGGGTAYTNTWALSALKAGETTSFEWDVTPIAPGKYTVKYSVAAGLNGNARAVADGGGPASGSFGVQISKTPAQSRVDPATGKVERLDG